MLEGVAIGSLSPSALAARLAYVPQREEIPVGFTVGEVVAMGAEAGGDPPQALPAIERLGLAALRDRRVETLSEGQRQRVTMARAFAQTRGMVERPGVLLADEPAAALDPALAAEAMSVFRELARRGRTVVVVLHDADLSLRWADRALLLRQDGTVLEQGPAAETLTPANLETLFGVRWAVVKTPDGGTGSGGGSRNAVIPV
jgi:iron complex transport system ATP-binding protein